MMKVQYSDRVCTIYADGAAARRLILSALTGARKAKLWTVSKKFATMYKQPGCVKLTLDRVSVIFVNDPVVLRLCRMYPEVVFVLG